MVPGFHTSGGLRFCNSPRRRALYMSAVIKRSALFSPCGDLHILLMEYMNQRSIDAIFTDL